MSVYAIIYNIPDGTRSKHLRKFFRVAIERKYFKCFHFRHRSSSTLASRKLSLELNTYACFIKVVNSEILQKLETNYNNTAWERDKPHLCKIAPLLTTESDFVSKLNASVIDLDQEIHLRTLKSYAELRPPRYLKRGNVGTPIASIVAEIRQCKFPSTLLTKLGIDMREEFYKKKYACFSWDYDNEVGFYCSETSRDGEDDADATLDPYELDDPAEEWERHEALHEDPFKMVPKERLFESEKEVVWEKGSSGLVWYTDAQYWDSLEGNDEKETDDWDVIPDEIDDEPELLKTMEGNQTKTSIAKKRRGKKPRSGKRLENGFGGILLKRYGWKVGQGLGLKNRGITEALPNDGQIPTDKRGFGYRGPKLFDFKTPGSL